MRAHRIPPLVACKNSKPIPSFRFDRFYRVEWFTQQQGRLMRAVSTKLLFFRLRRSMKMRGDAASGNENGREEISPAVSPKTEVLLRTGQLRIALINELPRNRTEEHLIPALLTPWHFPRGIGIGLVLSGVVECAHRGDFGTGGNEQRFRQLVIQLPVVVVVCDVQQLLLAAV